MAASALQTAVNTADTISSHASLPNSRCNFRSLTAGSRAPTCGCRKFWLDKPVNSQDGSNSAYCACGHHACFHDTVIDETLPPSLLRHSSAPSIPSDNNGSRHNGLLSGPRIRQPNLSPRARHSYDPTQQPGNILAPSDFWGKLNNFARWQHDPTWLPSTAPPSIMSCDQPLERQTAPIEQQQLTKGDASFERPYASLFPNMQGPMGSPTVQGTPITEQFDVNSPRADAPSDPRGSQRGLRSTRSEPPNPANTDIVVRKTRDREPSPKPSSLTVNKSQEAPTTPTKNNGVTPDVQNILKSCMRRLEELETISFYQVPVEEVQDKFELFDGRLLEMEYWRKDVDARFQKTDQALDDNGSQASVSFLDNLAHGGGKALFSRMSDVESRLHDLETAQPSYENPWEIEVVLLPFGRRLKGIWHDSMDDPKQSPSTPEEQTDEAKTTGGLHALSRNKEAAWNAHTIQAWADNINPWLWPKAPGPNNVVFKRLRSRGFVRNVTLTDTGAYGIWEALKEAFAQFVETPPIQRSDGQHQTYEALREPFVPLRKVKKSSWLRYLSPSDLVTSSTWDMSFLNSGVFMHGKGGRKRLYLTTADAYIQPGTTGWTWQQIRDLPVYEDTTAMAGTSTSGQPHPEPFWEHTAPLDDAPSFNSFVSHVSSLGKRRSTCVTFAEEHEMESPAAKSYASSSSGDTVTPRYSESFPIISRKPSQSKRRNSPSCTPIAYQKRRRTSGSPIYRGGLEELTPRWSHEPPTPLKDNIWETRSQCLAGSSRKRLSTPTAYATPHSHNVANVYLAMADGGDTEVESEGSDVAESEKEWGGLDEDDDGNEVSRPSSQSSYSGSDWMASDDESFEQEEDESDDGDSSYEP